MHGMAQPGMVWPAWRGMAWHGVEVGAHLALLLKLLLKGARELGGPDADLINLVGELSDAVKPVPFLLSGITHGCAFDFVNLGLEGLDVPLHPLDAGLDAALGVLGLGLGFKVRVRVRVRVR